MVLKKTKLFSLIRFPGDSCRHLDREFSVWLCACVVVKKIFFLLLFFFFCRWDLMHFFFFPLGDRRGFEREWRRSNFFQVSRIERFRKFTLSLWNSFFLTPRKRIFPKEVASLDGSPFLFILSTIPIASPIFCHSCKPMLFLLP